MYNRYARERFGIVFATPGPPSKRLFVKSFTGVKVSTICKVVVNFAE